MYEHAQTRPPLEALSLVLVAGTLAIPLTTGRWVLLFTPAVLLLAATLSFGLSRLTTTVDAGAVTVRFRWGRPSRTIPLDQILGAEAVRNTWWHGWGIRAIPGARMYNVWGLDAVHLDLGDNRDFRIGTDDPDGLVAAIEAAQAPRR